MEFKTTRQADEWKVIRGQGRGARLLLPPALLIDDASQLIAGREAIITGIFRTELEQKRINEAGRWRRGRRSVHEFWRAVDFRSWIYTAAQIEEITRRVNSTFRYNTTSGRELVVLAYHARGTGSHLHLQVPAGERWARTLGDDP